MFKKILLAITLYSLSYTSFSQTLQTVTDNGNVTTQGIRSANPTGDIGVYIYAHPDGTALIQSSNYADILPKNLIINKWGGNVGIGTATPAYKLDVSGAGNFGGLYVNGGTVWHTGNLTRPVQSYLTSNINTVVGGQGSIIESSNPFPDNLPANTTWFTGINLLANSNPDYTTQFGASVNGRLWTRYSGNGNWSAWTEILTSANANLSSYFLISGGNITGNVTIGSSSLQKDLAVNGIIKTRKVKVTQTDWADYVFDSAYQLNSLQTVETFIQKNKHLPDVPSAKEVKSNGIDLGDNQALLLKKIEELTLYIIQQNKQLEEQKQINNEQKKANETLENRLKAIEQKLISSGK